MLRSLGLGLITGAADDDPSAIGTYASAGAMFGPAVLWTAPATLPMMFVVVYLASKMGQVTGRGLFDVLGRRYPRWVLYTSLVGVMIGNTIEAAADIAGIAAAIGTLMAWPIGLTATIVTAAIVLLQLFGSYPLIRSTFRFLALALLAYVASAFLARPPLGPVLQGTFVPRVEFTREFLSILVAIIGTTLSAYLYTWQSNQEVEEEIAMGRRRLSDRQGATPAEIRHTVWDIVIGMTFSNVIMYFVILSTAATLYVAGRQDVSSAAEAAEALRPMAGKAAGLLFAIGLAGVGFLAVPVMTAGAAYDLCQTLGWKHGLFARPAEAPRFYAAIVGFSLVALALNFIGINPMKALVFAGIVQGFSTPPLLLLIMLTTNDRAEMGEWANGRLIRTLGWVTTAAVFAATGGLVVTWLM